MRRYLLGIAVLALVSLGASSVAAHAEWTTYHGDAALSGVDQSSATRLPVSLAWTVPGPCGDITPSVGITSTPVIDPATGTLYAVAPG